VLSAGGDDPTFGQSLLEAVGKNIRWDVGALWLVEPGSPAMACQATWSREPGSLPVLDQHLVGSRLGPGVTLAGKAWQTQEALWLADCTEDSCQERAVCLGAEGIRSSLAVPLRVGGDVLGVIEFFSRTPQAQDALLLDLLSGIGTQIALHLERERWLADPSYATLRLEAAPEPSGLPEPAVEVAVPAPAARSVVPEGRRVPAIPAELQGELKEMLHRAVPRLADWCIITLLDPQGTVAQNLVAHVSPIKAQLLEGVLRSQPLDPQGAPEHPKVLVTGKPEWASVVRPDARQTGVWDHTHLQAFRVLGLRSNYCVPLIWRSELLGALTLATAESGRTLGSDDRPIAQQLAAQITRALVAATGPTPG
jgi:GAF domain-containing protein